MPETQNNPPSKSYRHNLTVGALLALAVLLVVLFFSFARASGVSQHGTESSMTTATAQTQTVAAALEDSLQVVATTSDASGRTQSMLARLAARIHALEVRRQAPVIEKASQQTTVSLGARTGLSARVLALLAGAGKPKEGQVLMYLNGKYTWTSLGDAEATALDASVHVSGYGRKPAFPINASSILHGAAGGGVSPERHYAGGGGNRDSSGSSGGSSTVTNVYNTYTTGGTGSLASFIGTSSVTSYNGSLSYSSQTGYAAANAICAANYTGSHICTAEEILGTIANKNISTLFSGVADAWIAQGPPGYTANSNDCLGWTSASTSYLGAWWDFNATTGGIGYLTSCASTKPIACCKVQ